MKRNLDKLGGLVFSQRVLLTLIDEIGISREDAYRIVQTNAMKIWHGHADNFLQLLKNDPEINDKIDQRKLEELFDLSYHTKYVDHIFNEVFNTKTTEAS